MRNQEQFKRLIRAAFCFILLLFHGGMFWNVWRQFYSPMMEIQYWMRGHLMILAFYLFWVFLLPRIYGGWRVGYLKIFHIVYSQSLGAAMADILIYCLIVLMTKHFVNPGPLLLMYVLQLVSALLWGAACTKMYIYHFRRVLFCTGFHY